MLPRIDIVTDTTAEKETSAVCLRRYESTPFSEKHMVEMCNNAASIMGLDVRYSSFKQASLDKMGRGLIDTIHMLEYDTRLAEDLHWLLLYMKNNAGKIKFPPQTQYELYKLVCGYARYCPFEPKWHMKKRGDDKRLPNKQPGNMWKFLLGLYTDPHESIRRIPDWVTRQWNNYPRYRECVDRAIADGHEWLKMAYGPDVDLTPKTDPVIQQAFQPAFTKDSFLDGSLLDSIRNA